MTLIRNTLLILLLIMFFSGNALACTEEIILVQADIVNLDEAIERVKKSKNGKILDAQTQELDGKPVHVIKVLTESGHVKKVRIQAVSEDE